MTYVVTKKNDDVLMHHGVMGMHWGIRRYQNNDGSLTAAGKARYGTTDGAKKIKKQLTEYDKASANAQYDYKRNEIKRQKFVDKADRADLKGKTNKAKMYEEKAKEYESERDTAERRVKNIDKTINDIINNAQREGYDVTMTRMARQAKSQKTKQFVFQLMAGPIGNAAYIGMQEAKSKRHGLGSSFSEGYSYKVTPGAGIVTEKRKDLKIR